MKYIMAKVIAWEGAEAHRQLFATLRTLNDTFSAPVQDYSMEHEPTIRHLEALKDRGNPLTPYEQALREDLITTATRMANEAHEKYRVAAEPVIEAIMRVSDAFCILIQIRVPDGFEIDIDATENGVFYQDHPTTPPVNCIKTRLMPADAQETPEPSVLSPIHPFGASPAHEALRAIMSDKWRRIKAELGMHGPSSVMDPPRNLTATEVRERLGEGRDNLDSFLERIGRMTANMNQKADAELGITTLEFNRMEVTSHLSVVDGVPTVQITRDDTGKVLERGVDLPETVYDAIARATKARLNDK